MVTEIRKQFDEKNGKWYFSIVDSVGIITKSSDARNYWKVLKNRLKKTDKELVTKCNQLKMMAKDGKFYLTDVADSETMIEIIESIPKTSSEAFKVLIRELEEIVPIPSAESSILDLPFSTDFEGQIGKENITESEMNGAKLLVDVYQTESLVWIEAMIAGSSLEDISIAVSSKQVIISGKREGEGNILEKNYLYQELLWTSFYRKILLPCPVQTDKIQTKEDNGQLTIKLAKI